MFSPKTVHEAERIEKLIQQGCSIFFCCFIFVIAFMFIKYLHDSPADSNESSSVNNATMISPAPSGTPIAQLVDTPSQNISCELHDDFVGCSIRYRTYSEYGLDDCTSELYSIKLSSGTEVPQSACGEQYLGSPGDYVHRLEYGHSAYFSDFACTAEVTGLRCWKQSTGHGFILSRENHEFF